MKEIILIKDGEIVLKGMNKRAFEDKLIGTIKRRLDGMGDFNIMKAQSTIMVMPREEDFDFEEAVTRVSCIFGISGFSRACVAEKELEDIKKKSVEYLRHILTRAKTFKVEAKRADKAFPYKSPQICEQVGGYILENFDNLTVDVHNPDVTVMVEIRDFAAYIHGEQIKGAGGIPVGTGGRAAILISGGIDSPVAAWTMAKRGIELIAIHFASPPYTSKRAELKVEELLSRVARYAGRITLFTVPFTHIQEEIGKKCPEDYFTIIMRRYMMKIAAKIAGKEHCKALITGESLGQVASQTLNAIVCTDAACDMPVLRPLIGMDKDEIVTISRKIDTFEISIQPYEDCCTVFTPKHPKTQPRLHDVLEAESDMDEDNLIKEAVEGTEEKRIERN